MKVKKDALFIPEKYSAKNNISVRTIGLLLLILFSILLGIWLLFGINPIIIFIGLTTIYYLFSLLFKLYLVSNSKNSDILKISEKDIKDINNKKLPHYSILIPLYREKEIVKQLLAEIKNMDWPKDKLDVKILLEEDDKDTIGYIKNEKLPNYFDIIIVPNSYPKTKPKALNVGMMRIKGKYVTIYDAEDMPEKDQLKKAYLSFQKLPKDYICIQAKLNYYNKDQNWLTKLFTSEYATWFDFYLPGLMSKNYPIPLGGTSNHFKADILKKIGAWDSYNVTEDCDLGMRIHRLGYKIAIMDSTTWEEANSEIDNWIRQRSRWIKGYIQTFIVHMRNPRRTLKEFGLENFIVFLFFVGASPVTPILNLFFWILTIVWFLTHASFIQYLFPPMIFYPALFSLYFGNFIIIYLSMVGCINREFYNIIKWSLLSPVYWLLMAFAAIKASWQMIVNPHFWEKTKHGLYLWKNH